MNAGRLGRLLASTALLVSLVTLAARLFGFGRWLVFSPTVGSGGVGTAYQSANQLPNVLFEVIAGGALTGAIVPLLAAPLAAVDRRTVDRISSALLTWAITATLPLAVLLAVLHRPLAELLLDGSGAQQAPGTVDLASRLLLMFAPQLVFYAIGAVLVGVLQSHRRFLWPAFMPLLSSTIVMISYVVYSARSGGADPAGIGLSAELWLGLGTTAGVVALAVPLLLPTRHAGVRLRLTWSFPAGVARRAVRLAAAGLSTVVAQQASVVVILLLANRVGGTGVYVVFSYTQAIYLLPYAVLAVPLATIAFPKLSELAQMHRPEDFAAQAARGLRVILLAGFAGTALLIAAAMPLQQFFQSIDAARESSQSPLAAMATAVVLMGLGLPGWTLVAYLTRVCFALERSRYAAIGAAAGWISATIATLVLVPFMVTLRPAWISSGDQPSSIGEATLGALTLGNAIGMTIAGIVLLWALGSIAGREAFAGVGRTLLAVVPAALLAALLGVVVASVLLGSLPFGPVVSAVLAGLAAGLLALVLVVASGHLLGRGMLAELRRL